MTKIVMMLQGQFRGTPWNNLILLAENVEAGYDTVAHYIARGLVLEEIKIGKDGQWIAWPVDVFTDQALERQTQPLRQEWESILTPLPVSSPWQQKRQAFLRQQICFYESQMASTTQRMVRTERALQQAMRLHDSVFQTLRMRQLQQQLLGQRVNLAQLQEARQLVAQYLDSLAI